MNSNATMLQQIESFGVFAIIMIALASFEKTHMIAVWIIGIIALAIILNYFGKNPTALSAI